MIKFRCISSSLHSARAVSELPSISQLLCENSKTQPTQPQPTRSQQPTIFPKFHCLFSPVTDVRGPPMSGGKNVCSKAKQLSERQGGMVQIERVTIGKCKATSSYYSTRLRAAAISRLPRLPRESDCNGREGGKR